VPLPESLALRVPDQSPIRAGASAAQAIAGTARLRSYALLAETFGLAPR
jgi:hypothetical protein